MILIIGGTGSGKKSYAASLGYSSAQMSGDAYSRAPVATDIHELLRADPSVRLLPVLASKEVVTCAEVGCGVVPACADLRDYREAVGRLCIDLAAVARRVVRMQCGIPQIIKDI